MSEVGSDFYVGYQPKAPARLARMLAIVVAALGAGGLVVAAVLVTAQAPFASSRFEYLQYKPYRGTLYEWPYPTLLTPAGHFLLVGSGKHGLLEAAKGLEGRSVSFDASLIEHGSNRMLELVDGTLKAGDPSGGSRTVSSVGHLTLSGEIVDTKCYLGVMNPGKGKVHRDCAARCISGGIPPGFLVRDAEGGTRVLLLVGPDGRRLGREILSYAAEPITIKGELFRIGQQLVFRADPDVFKRE